MGADERTRKERRVITAYDQLVLEIRPLVQDVLIKLAVANDYHKNVLKTWRELENHARVIPCCQHSETGAQVYVRYHPTDYSNYELQLEKFKKLNKKISTLYSIPQSELNKTLSRHKPQPTPSNGVVDPEDKLRRFTIDWKTVRSMLKEATGKVQLGSSALTLPETNRLQSSHPLLAEFAMRLNILQKKDLHCRHCLESYFFADTWAIPANRDDLEEKKHYTWVTIADKTRYHRGLRSESRGSTTTGVVFRNSDGGQISEHWWFILSEYEKSAEGGYLSGYAIGDQISPCYRRCSSAWTAWHDQPVCLHCLAPAVVDRLSGELVFLSQLAAHMNQKFPGKWCKSPTIRFMPFRKRYFVQCQQRFEGCHARMVPLSSTTRT